MTTPAPTLRLTNAKATTHDETKVSQAVAFLRHPQVQSTPLDERVAFLQQKGVGAALKGLPRDSFFITTKTKPCAEMTEAACSAQAARQARNDGPIAASSRSTAAARATRKPFTRRKGLNQLGL